MKDLSKHIKQAIGFWLVFSIGVWLSWNIFHYYEVMGSMPWFYWVFGIVSLTIMITGWYHAFQNVETIATECRRRIES